MFGFLLSLFSLCFRSISQRSSVLRLRFRPFLESLERREVPAQFTVTAITDNGSTGELRAAVQGVDNSTDQTNSIIFAPSLQGATITLTQGELSLAKPVTIDGGTNNVTISGGKNSRIFEVVSGTDTIQNLTFTKGTVVNGNGGALLVDNGASVTLFNDTFSSNFVSLNMNLGANGGAIGDDGTLIQKTSSANGGAIEDDGTLGIASCTFTNNSAAGNGGAVNSNGVDQTNSVLLTVLSSTFTSNQAILQGSGSGGAIAVNNTLTAVSQSTFTSNSSSLGGGAILSNISDLSSPTVAPIGNLSLVANFFSTNTSSKGGAVASETYAYLGAFQINVWNNTFYQNNATNTNSGGSGGGLYLLSVAMQNPLPNSASIATSLINDTFFKNTAVYGGGAYLEISNFDQGTVSITLTSLTVNQNTASQSGGGLDLGTSPNTPNPQLFTFDNNIIDGNLVSVPGYEGAMDVTTSGNQVQIDDRGYNLLGTSDTTVGFTNPNNNDIFANNPGLAPALATNNAAAGYPMTLALVQGSIAYRQGDQTLASANAPNNIDGRGLKRQSVQNGAQVSIGAEDPDAIAS